MQYDDRMWTGAKYATEGRKLTCSINFVFRFFIFFSRNLNAHTIKNIQKYIFFSTISSSSSSSSLYLRGLQTQIKMHCLPAQ